MLFMTLFAFLIATLFPAAHATGQYVTTAHSLALRRAAAADASAFLDAHNDIRKAHNATALIWSAPYAAKAALWADQCKFTRTEGRLSTTPYGELHAAATGTFDIPTAIDQFVKDKGEYDPAKPTYNHFTQIVWKDTTQVGCAKATCNNLLGRRTGLATYYVCLYDPAGNVVGKAA
ncbi:hypothetical protein H0H87_001703 [Tephrocybe sp. NHM501043]|nr:hypothetical protein H0H87_001703 [Tephrocybe sp. NHM501043]